MMVSPAEPAALRALGKVSSVPELHGADFLWLSPLGSVGVQRKEFPGDFLSSMTDGRLAKEVGQLQSLSLKILILEGRGSWSVDGTLLHDWGQSVTRNQIDAYLFSIMLSGVWVVWVGNRQELVQKLEVLEGWTKKAKHHSLLRRPGPATVWGKPSSKEWSLHFLQGLPGMGPELAERVLDHFDGALPFGWTCEKEELEEVHGLGPKRVERVWKALNNGG